MKKIQTASKVVYGLIIFVLLVVAISVIGSYFNIAGFKIYTVQSGSMEPSIHVGGIVISHKATDYSVDDVITFSPDNKPENLVTHRIYRVNLSDNTRTFTTKGDANRTPDPNLVQKSMILGKVVFSLPILGYAIAFARTQTGLIVLIIIPSTLIIYSELLNIKNEATKIVKRKHEEKATD